MIDDRSPDVLIVGGGVIGMSCAWHLTRAGARVTVIESAAIGDRRSCSYGNQGLVCPSHAVPIAAPGVVAQGLRWLFDPTGPLYIRSPWRAEMLRWLWRFTRAATPARAEAGTAAMAELLLRSADLHARMAASAAAPDGGHPYGYAADGVLYAFLTPEGLRHHLHESRQAARHGIPFRQLTGDQVRQMEPALSPRVVGGVLYPGDAHVDPGSFVRWLHRQAIDAGVQVVEQTDVIRLQPGGPGGRASALTSRGEIGAGQIVIAAGAWSPLVAADLDLRLPVQAAKGYSITFSRPPWRPRRPVNLGEARAVATPLPHGVRIGGTLELAGLDRSIALRRVQAILDGAGRLVPGAHFDAGAPDAEVWRGLRPLAPDALPIIGRPRAHPNVVLATAHGTLGVSLAPATGEAVAALIAGNRPAIDLHPCRPDRFA